MKFELFKNLSEAWHWRLLGRDGQIVAVSAQGHLNKKRVYEIIDDILKLDEAELIDVNS